MQEARGAASRGRTSARRKRISRALAEQLRSLGYAEQPAGYHLLQRTG